MRVGIGSESFPVDEESTENGAIQEVKISNDDIKTFLEGYKTVLNTKANEESLVSILIKVYIYIYIKKSVYLFFFFLILRYHEFHTS